MKKKFFTILFLCLLTGCLSSIRSQLDSCTATAKAAYPNDKAMPLEQPYKDILHCMQDAGYELDYNSYCKYVDYTSMISNARCYRPTEFFSGYFHDLITVLR